MSEASTIRAQIDAEIREVGDRCEGRGKARQRTAAQAIVDKVAPLVRAAIAQLDPPWFVCTSGLEIISPQPGDPFTPYFVCLERLNGLEQKVIAVPQAGSESEARTLAEAQCRAERAGYREAGNKLVEQVLREHGAWEAHKYLRNLRLIEEDEREERRRANEPPVVKVIGKAPLSDGALPNWADGAKRAPAQAQKDICRIIPQPAKKPEKRVIDVSAPPDEAELRRREIAAQNKW